MFASISQPTPARADAFAPWRTALVVWLVLGSVALLFVPALRETDSWFGWLPFWLVVAPAIDLAVLRRRQGIAWLRALFAACREQLRLRQRQARPLRGRRLHSARSIRTIASPSRAPAQSVMPRRLRSMRRRNSPMILR